MLTWPIWYLAQKRILKRLPFSYVDVLLFTVFTYCTYGLELVKNCFHSKFKNSFYSLSYIHYSILFILLTQNFHRQNQKFHVQSVLKGIVSRDWEQIQWIPSDRFEECRVAGAYFFSVLKPFLCLILKMPALAVSHLTVTLRMISNNWRSFSAIGAVLVWLIL